MKTFVAVFAAFAFMTASSASFADHQNVGDISLKDHRIDYGSAASYAYRLADLAEAMSWGGFSEGIENDIGLKDHREVRRAADRLHQAASRLYYGVRTNDGLGTLDHRSDRCRSLFSDVRYAYQRLSRVAYGYRMNQIHYAYRKLSYAIMGY